MDLATIVGLVLCFVLCIFGMTFDQANMSFDFTKVQSFIDVPSILITLGGAFMCCLAMTGGFPDFINKLKSIKFAIKKEDNSDSDTIKSIIDLSNIARKEGLLALEDTANNTEDIFLKKGLMLIVDGTDPEFVSRIMETELEALEERHKDNIAFWENVASMGPAWGMIGTLIGLVNMLKNMSDDVGSVGPNMAVALITTFYGSLLANWIATPIATKLKRRNATELTNKGIIIEGLLSIQAGENPRVIEEKLKSFMAPKDRAGISDSEE